MDHPQPIAPLRAVFVDIGDTVMRPDPSWEDIYAVAFREFGVEVSVPDLQVVLRKAYHHGGWGLSDGFDPSPEASFRRTVEIDAGAIAELGIGPMPESFYRRLNEMFGTPDNWHVFADSRPALDALRARGLVVGALSNWVWHLPDLLDALDLGDRFDFVAASARVGFEKPNPGIFQFALERAGVTPPEALHVGDHLDADVQGAQNLGIGAAFIDRRGRYQAAQVPDGVPLIRSLAELLPVVDERIREGMAESA